MSANNTMAESAQSVAQEMRKSDPAMETGNTSKFQALGEIGLTRFEPYLMNRIMERWNFNLQERMVGSDLTTVRMRALAVLSVISGLTINELSVYAVIEQSTMSRTLDVLEKQGLIQRKARASDGRVREIYITEVGRTEFDKFWPAMYEDYRHLFAGIDDAERETFLKTLHKMLSNIHQHDM